jgi:hypothetical protein
MIVNHHQTNVAFTTLTAQQNGMYKVVHISPNAFKYQVKKDFYEALDLYDKMVDYTLNLGKRPFIDQGTPQRPLAETAPLRSFNRYKNPLLQC